MISQFFDIQEFIEAVKGKEYGEILRLAERELHEAESRSKVRGRVKAGRQGSARYASLLRKLSNFLRAGSRPDGIDDRDFQLFHPIADNLVRAKHFGPEVMDLFK
jgi:hypothetical protein